MTQRVFGAVDVGSNGIRSEIPLANAANEVIRQRYAARYSHKVFVSGRLARGARQRALVTLKEIHGKFESAGVTDQRWVCTSAVGAASKAGNAACSNVICG